MQSRPRIKKARRNKNYRCPKCQKLLRQHTVRCKTCHLLQSR